MHMNIIIFALAIIGLLISYKIKYNKKHKIHVCPIGSNCKDVLSSQYNKTFGIPNETNGLIYYGLLAFAYSFTLFNLEPTPFLRTILLLLTTSAFLFSLYLTFIQGFQLKKWCTWCLSSAVISTSIFATVVLSTIPYQQDIINFLMYQRDILIFVYSLGFAIGIGATTSAHILFFRFLKDFKITKREREILHYQTQVVWVGLLMIILGGAGLLMTNYAQVISNPTAVLQLIMICVLILSEAFLTLFIAPHMSKISYKRKLVLGTLCSWRKTAFSLGGISLITWYLAFSLNYFSGFGLPLFEQVFIYLGIIIITLMTSQIIEQEILYRFLKEESKK